MFCFSFKLIDHLCKFKPMSKHHITSISSRSQGLLGHQKLRFSRPLSEGYNL